MKISIVSSYDSGGGAARSAYRLHQELVKNKIDSTFYTQSKRTDDFTVITKNKPIHKFINLMRPYLDQIPVWLYRKRDRKRLFSPAVIPSGSWIKKKIFDTDILHLHWIASGFISVGSLKKIKTPVVWTLHDSWAFTGGCHLPADCKKYQSSCGACPQLQSTNEYDLSKMIHERKKSSWSSLDLTIVTPSRWLASCAQSSSLFKNANIEVIPNGIDIKIFKPIDKKICRSILGLHTDKKIVLFGAMDPTSDINKGYKFLKPLFEELVKSCSSDIELVIFGSSRPRNAINFPFKTHYLGYLKDDISLAVLYSAADVFLAPSMQENLPNTVMESMACGTPVLAFNIGGMPDLVQHKVDGFLANPYDVGDLTEGMRWILKKLEIGDDLSLKCRSKIIENFDLTVIAKRYLTLYDVLLNKRRRL